VCWLAPVVAVVASIAPLRADIIEQVLVKVNGDIVTLSDFEKLQLAALRDRARDRPELAKLPANSPEIEKAIAESAPQLILGAVDELLLLQRAKEHGWSLTDERFNEIVADIRKSNNLDDDAAFRAALKQEGMTEATLREQIEKDMLLRQVRTVDVFEKISVTEDEVQEYYSARKGEFTTPAELTLREILIPVKATEKGVNVAEDEAARAKAEDTRKRLLAGEPFAQLAGELSASGSKANGGLLPPIRLQDLATALQDELSPLKVGEITPVVPTTAGYHIFKVESRSETKVRSLDDARSDVSRRVAEQKSEAETLKYLDRLRSQAKITWRHEELKRAYEKALADRRARAGLPVTQPPQS
jgi:peptidyl-prolyl cis-trans isomerase SurA